MRARQSPGRGDPGRPGPGRPGPAAQFVFDRPPRHDGRPWSADPTVRPGYSERRLPDEHARPGSSAHHPCPQRRSGGVRGQRLRVRLLDVTDSRRSGPALAHPRRTQPAAAGGLRRLGARSAGRGTDRAPDRRSQHRAARDGAAIARDRLGGDQRPGTVARPSGCPGPVPARPGQRHLGCRPEPGGHHHRAGDRPGDHAVVPCRVQRRHSAGRSARRRHDGAAGATDCPHRRGDRGEPDRRDLGHRTIPARLRRGCRSGRRSRRQGRLGVDRTPHAADRGAGAGGRVRRGHRERLAGGRLRRRPSARQGAGRGGAGCFRPA